MAAVLITEVVVEVQCSGQTCNKYSTCDSLLLCAMQILTSLFTYLHAESEIEPS